VFVIDGVASRIAYLLRQPPFTLELSLDGGATYAGVSSVALAAYRETHSEDALATVTRVEGYSHMLGLALAPRARLTLEGAELGAEARTDRLSALRVLDPARPAHGMAPIFEGRRRGEVWLSVGPPGGVARATFFADAYERNGSVGDASYLQREYGCGARLEAVF
jgi:hypothetical protein